MDQPTIRWFPSLLIVIWLTFLCVTFFVFILFGICWPLWIYRFMTYILLGKYIFCLILSLFFFLLLWDPNYRNVVILSLRFFISLPFVWYVFSPFLRFSSFSCSVFTGKSLPTLCHHQSAKPICFLTLSILYQHGMF